MGRGRLLTSLAAAAVALLLVPGAGAADVKAWTSEAKAARAALERSVAAGLVSTADAERYVAILRHARAVRDRVPPRRAALLDSVLERVARPKSPIAERAFSLYSTLGLNAGYLDGHAIPASGTDVEGDDGVVFRFFSGQGFAFHPLANAARLNALVAGGRTAEASALADAVAAWATPSRGGGLVWEYQADFGAARAPWTSGMAQAVMAQALARVDRLELARRAFRAIPGELDRQVDAGPWVELYGGVAQIVLNAQLQSAISIADYAELAGDGEAAAYADRLLAAAKAMLPRFDTGHWSLYSLGAQSTLSYHDFVIGLLKQLDKRTGDPAWKDAATRFAGYETEPPLMTATSVTEVVYPKPEDGVRDRLVVGFRLSKPARVALVVDGKAVNGFTDVGGRHTLSWTPRGLAPGMHEAKLVARSADGNAGSTSLPSFAVERDTVAPELSATKADGRVFWSAKDRESRCCTVRLELRRGPERKVLTPSRRRGAARIPAGYWSVTVNARDAAGNLAARSLGLVIGRAPAG